MQAVAEYLFFHRFRRKRGSVFSPQEICELINRADVTALVYDELRADAAAMAKDARPNLTKIISMQKEDLRKALLKYPCLSSTHGGLEAPTK